jgi:uncharacterized Rmd1/YagE family protein
MNTMTENEFYEKYDLIDNHIDDNAGFDGKFFETYGEEVAFVMEMAKENRVITIIECVECEETEGSDFETIDSNFYLVSGMHLVNRFGYLITEEPITEDFEVKLD